MNGEERRVEIPGTTVHSLGSELVGDDFEIWVAEPGPRLGFGAGGVEPVEEAATWTLYLLDGNLYFGTAVEATRLMHGLYGELPPIRVVGISYPTDDPQRLSALRNRDFTPVPDPRFAVHGWGQGSGPAGGGMGRADAFLAALEGEIRPLVEARHGRTAGTALWGSSLGGLLVAHALLTHPGTFDVWIAVSPSLWWADGRIFGTEAETAGSRDDLPGRLFVAVGELEEDPRIPALAPFRMVTHVDRFVETLGGRGYPSLEVAKLVAAEESHTSVPGVGLTRGLRWALGPGGPGTRSGSRHRAAPRDPAP